MNSKSERKATLIAICISVILSLIIVTIVGNNNYKDDYKIAEQKIEAIDENTIEFFIGDNKLDKTYNKIKNKQYDKIDLVDKRKINNVLDLYTTNITGKYIEIDGVRIKLIDYLKSDANTINRYLPTLKSDVKYLTIFYKIVIGGDTEFAKYLNENVNEKRLNIAIKNKRIDDAKSKIFEGKAMLFALLTGIIFIPSAGILTKIYEE